MPVLLKCEEKLQPHFTVCFKIIIIVTIIITWGTLAKARNAEPRSGLYIATVCFKVELLPFTCVEYFLLLLCNFFDK